MDNRSQFCPFCNAAIPASRLDALAQALVDAPSASNERYFHDDLAAMTVEALRLERFRISLGMSLASAPGVWAMKRLARIEQELKVRRAH